MVEHEIELKPDFRVKEFAAYRIAFAYRPEVHGKQIQDMLQQGIIGSDCNSGIPEFSDFCT